MASTRKKLAQQNYREVQGYYDGDVLKRARGQPQKPYRGSVTAREAENMARHLKRPRAGVPVSPGPAAEVDVDLLMQMVKS